VRLVCGWQWAAQTERTYTTNQFYLEALIVGSMIGGFIGIVLGLGSWFHIDEEFYFAVCIEALSQCWWRFWFRPQ